MIEYFPKVHKDELLYSLVSRYHKDILITNNLETYRDLFNTENMVMSIDFPSRINELVDRIGIGEYFNANNIIYRHTMFPLFYPFLDQERQIILYEDMLNSHWGKEIHMKIGIMGSGIKVNRYLRYCPKCVKEDIALYGEPYWHRSHNVPGVYYCYRHEVALSERCSSSGEYLYKKDQRKLVALSESVERGDMLTAEIPIMDISVTQQQKVRLIDIAKSVQILLEGNSCEKGIHSKKIYEVYYYKLDEYNMLDNSGRVKLKQLGQKLQEYYGKEILIELELMIDVNAEYSWLKSFFGKREYTAAHPLKHIVTINWLYNGKIEQFFKDLERKLVRKKELQWPCLNKAAEHYKQHIIKGYDTSYNSKAKYYIATFSCECGFVYTRRLKQLDDIYSKSRVVKFGDVWESKLFSLLEDGNLSINEISRRLAADRSVILKYGIKLGLIDKSKQRKYSKVRGTRKKTNDFKQEVKMSIRPQSEKTRIDWNARDEKLSENIRSLVESSKYISNKKRITKNWIGKQLNCLYYLQKHIDKLPLTKSLIENYIKIDMKGYLYKP